MAGDVDHQGGCHHTWLATCVPVASCVPVFAGAVHPEWTVFVLAARNVMIAMHRLAIQPLIRCARFVKAVYRCRAESKFIESDGLTLTLTLICDPFLGSQKEHVDSNSKRCCL